MGARAVVGGVDAFGTGAVVEEASRTGRGAAILMTAGVGRAGAERGAGGGEETDGEAISLVGSSLEAFGGLPRLEVGFAPGFVEDLFLDDEEVGVLVPEPEGEA
jgi:hypothetical protein